MDEENEIVLVNHSQGGFNKIDRKQLSWIVKA